MHSKFEKDISRDGNGVYDFWGTHGYEYDENFKYLGEAKSIYADIEEGYMVVRKCARHSVNKDFMRVATHLRSRYTEFEYNCVLVQYYFKPGATSHQVPLLPHGNAGNKTTAKFSSICSSVTEEVRNKMKTVGVTKAVHRVIAEKGGIEKIPSHAGVPNRRAIYQANKYLSVIF